MAVQCGGDPGRGARMSKLLKEGRDVHYACDRSDPRHLVVVSNRPAYVAKHAEQHRLRQDKPERRLVDASIALGHPDDPPVAERTSHDETKDE